MTFQKILRNAKVSQAELHYENSEKKKKEYLFSLDKQKFTEKNIPMSCIYACAKVK